MAEEGYFWQGERVRLRPVRPEDWERLYEESRDTAGIRLFEPGVQLPRTPERFKELVANWAERLVAQEPDDQLTFAVEDLAGEFVGMINIHNRNSQAGTFGLAVRIFRPFRRRGYGLDATRVLLRYAFEELRYQKANNLTVVGNDPSIRMHEALGFQVEGRMRRNVYTGGVYHDEILFGMTREEYAARWGGSDAGQGAGDGG